VTATPTPRTPTLEETAELAGRVLDEVGKAIVGKKEALRLVLCAVLAKGHVLLEDYPGLGKTLAARSFARALGLDFARAQFTPDLLPSDLTGSFLYNQRTSEFEFRSGPLFTGLLLADEINRTPPKTQSALLEAMQEHRVTIQGRTYQLEEPFYVFATQNPIELEGTYPLPEAQLDRFMFHIIIEHPPYDEELEVARTTTAIQNPQLQRPITGEDLVAFQRLVRKVPVSEPVLRHALDIVRATRAAKNPDAKDFIKKWVAFGGSVRAAQYLILGGMARALTSGRYHVSFEDIRALAHPVLRHRIITNFHAQSEGVTTDQIVDRLLEVVPLPRSGM
jgi:MoxR-like ATPase